MLIKKIIYFVLVVLLVVVLFDYDELNTLSSSITANAPDNKIKLPDSFAIRKKDRIHSSMPEYEFAVFADKRSDGYGYEVSKIVISDTVKSADIQKLTFPKTLTVEKACLGFYIEDIDFDGYKDIKIQTANPPDPNAPYYCWVWDKSKSKYVQGNSLE